MPDSGPRDQDICSQAIPLFPLHLKIRETETQDPRSVEEESNTQPLSKPFLAGRGSRGVRLHPGWGGTLEGKEGARAKWKPVGQERGVFSGPTPTGHRKPAGPGAGHATPRSSSFSDRYPLCRCSLPPALSTHCCSGALSRTQL